MILDGAILWLVASLAVTLGIAGVTGTLAAVRRQRSLRRIADGLSDLLGGHEARRIVVPEGGLAARIADDVNELAERFSLERESRAEREDAHRKLLANISHDLRTPLTAIAGYADALSRGIGNDPERYLAILSAKTAELSRLTDDLFYLTRMDAGDISLDRVEFDLAEEVAAALLVYEAELEACGADVTVALPETPCLVTGDPHALRRVVGNLVSNALRHAKGMTRFEVTVAPGRDGTCAAHFIDDGAGFSSVPETLFERGVAEHGGTGLGLAIAYGLVKRMGGTVLAESEPGVRTVFGVSLPHGGGRDA